VVPLVGLYTPNGVESDAVHLFDGIAVYLTVASAHRHRVENHLRPYSSGGEGTGGYDEYTTHRFVKEEYIG